MKVTKTIAFIISTITTGIVGLVVLFSKYFSAVDLQKLGNKSNFCHKLFGRK
jgi:hypothetical protein